MIKWAIKRYVISKVNSLLDEYKNNVDKVKDTLQTWIARLEKILACFKSTLAKLDDGKIDSDEIDQTVAEVEEVVKSW